MPKFLNHLDLNGNQLKNTKLEITDSPLAEEGVIHYHDTNNTVRYHDGTGFVTLGDNDIATSTAAGVVELFSDTAQTVAANTVSTTSSRTYGVQLNSDDQMVVNVPWTDANDNTQNAYSVSIQASTTKLRLTGSGAAGATTDDIEFVGSGATTVTRTSADKFTISSTDTQPLDNAGVIAKVLTGLSTTTGGAVAATDTILAGFGKLEKRVALNDAKVTNTNLDNAGVIGKVLTGLSTGSGGTVAAADSILEAFGKLENRVAVNDGKVTNTDVSVSKDNLESTLALIDTSITIGSGASIDTTISGDLTVDGDLLVSGDTVTVNVGTLEVEDKNITIAKGAANATAADGAGLTITGAAATLLYRSTGDKFVFNKDLYATSFQGPLTGNVTGNADTVTTNADLSGHITSSGNTASLGSFTVAELSAALSNATISGNNSGDGTYGIADTNYVKIDGTPVDGEFAQFTANGLVSRTDAEVVSDIGAVAANSAIAGATKAKITFDAKGLVTGGADLASADIPNNAADTTGSSGSTTGNAATATVLATGAVGGVKVFELTHTGTGAGQVANENSSNSTDSAVWTITHGMGSSRFYKVEVVLDSGDYDTVYVDVQRPLDTTIAITFGADVANGAYRAMVTRMA